MGTLNDSVLKGFRTWIFAMSALVLAWYAYFHIADVPADDALDGFGDILDGLYYSIAYALIAIVGYLVWGRKIATRFGGFSSYIGRAVHFISIGTISWGLGNFVWFYLDTCDKWGVLS